MANKRPGYGALFVELPENLLDALAIHCAKNRTTRAAVVEAAVRKWIGHKAKPVKPSPSASVPPSRP